MDLEKIVAQNLASKINFGEPVEEPTQESSLTDNNSVVDTTVDNSTPEPVQEPTNVAESTSQPQINMDEIRTQLRQELEQEYSSKQPSFANETIAKLNELAASGINIDSPDFWKWQYTDLDNYDTSNAQQALELRRLELELENPNLNAKQIERLLKRTYTALFDESYTADDTEYQEALEDLSIDATRSVTKLKKHKESVQLPKVTLQNKEEIESKNRQVRENFIKDVRTNVQSYTEDTIKLDKDLEIKYIPNDDTKKFIESAIISDQNFFVDNYVKENKVDFGRLRRDMARIYDFDNIIKAVYEQGVSVGKEQVVDNLENSSNSITSQKQQVTKDIKTQILEQFARQNSRKR